jgi:hypothetical protein
LQIGVVRLAKCETGRADMVALAATLTALSR